MSEQLKLHYKIFMEAEDISQSRILSSISFVKNILGNHKNPYISKADLDDESDLDDFVLRLYVKESAEEANALSREAAEGFIDDMAALVSEIAHMHSFMDLEGSFSIEYEGESLAYTFSSESGNGSCDFQEIEDTE